MTAEYENEKGIWVPRPGVKSTKRPRDATVYGLAIDDVAGIRLCPRGLSKGLARRAADGDRKPAAKHASRPSSWIGSNGYQRAT